MAEATQAASLHFSSFRGGRGRVALLRSLASGLPLLRRLIQDLADPNCCCLSSRRGSLFAFQLLQFVALCMRDKN